MTLSFVICIELIACNLQYITTKYETIIDKVNRFNIIGRSEFVVEIEYKSCIVVSPSTTGSCPIFRSEASTNDSIFSFDKNKIWPLIKNFLGKDFFTPSISRTFVNILHQKGAFVCGEIIYDLIILIAICNNR